MEDLFDLFEESSSKRKGPRAKKRASSGLAGYALKEAMGQDSMGEYRWNDIDSHLAMGDDFDFSTRGTGESEISTGDEDFPKEEE